MPRKTPDREVVESRGNIFEDLQLPRAKELYAKAELVRRMLSVIRKRGLTQKQAAKLLGIDQPKVSALLNGNFTGFSTDRLFRLLTRLGADIEITIKPKTSQRAQEEIRVSRKVTSKAQ
jgi:predicted XRE-type DNA-binding protein